MATGARAQEVSPHGHAIPATRYQSSAREFLRNRFLVKSQPSNLFVILTAAISSRSELIAESKAPCNVRTIVATSGDSHRTIATVRMPCYTYYAASFTGVLRLRDKLALRVRHSPQDDSFLSSYRRKLLWLRFVFFKFFLFVSRVFFNGLRLALLIYIRFSDPDRQRPHSRNYTHTLSHRNRAARVQNI